MANDMVMVRCCWVMRDDRGAVGVKGWLLALLCRRSRWHNAEGGWHRRTTGKPEVYGSRGKHECRTRIGKRGVTVKNFPPS
ncbi:hypothetical protein V6N11_001432 [Hibiscus sabdariffa]|uniref:Uncharacterized protein n=1 Tax=Hibiscus sabdariffa TaxID=183260 RepID=A0ABR2S0J3_9ROSI